jgi:hypothetical protein
VSVRTRASLAAAVDARWRVLGGGLLATVDTPALRAQVWRNRVTGLWEWDTLAHCADAAGPVGGWRGSMGTPSGSAPDAAGAVAAAEAALSEARRPSDRRGGGAW